MAQHWYPVIDYSLCTECGACTEKCAHGVYNIEKAPTPVVVRPENCIGHCHGCGNICPQGAITYLGDDTAWTPPHAQAPEPTCDCGCSCGGCCG